MDSLHFSEHESARTTLCELVRVFDRQKQLFDHIHTYLVLNVTYLSFNLREVICRRICIKGCSRSGLVGILGRKKCICIVRSPSRRCHLQTSGIQSYSQVLMFQIIALTFSVIGVFMTQTHDSSPPLAVCPSGSRLGSRE